MPRLKCLGFFLTLRQAISHGGRADTVRESAPEFDSRRKKKKKKKKKNLPHRGLEPASVLHLAFQSDAVPTELSASWGGLVMLRSRR